MTIRSNDRHHILRVASYVPAVFSKMWCLTTGPLIGISVFADVFPRDRTAGVSSMICTVTKKSKSLTYAVASSFVCPSPLAVMTVVGVSGYSNDFAVQLSSDLSCSTCALRLRNLPQMFFHLVSFKDGAVRLQTSEGEKNIALSSL